MFNKMTYKEKVEHLQMMWTEMRTLWLKIKKEKSKALKNTMEFEAKILKIKYSSFSIYE
jgi:hypothetical protein